MRTAVAIALASCAMLCTGCVRRTVMVTSTPPGALVWLNDREVGRTPVEVDITYYGRYDVRIVHEDYEPLQTYADANAPLWDMPGPDLIAEVAPLNLQSKATWHFDLEPASTDPDAVTARARDLRETLGEPIEDAE